MYRVMLSLCSTFLCNKKEKKQTENVKCWLSLTWVGGKRGQTWIIMTFVPGVDRVKRSGGPSFLRSGLLGKPFGPMLSQNRSLGAAVNVRDGNKKVFMEGTYRSLHWMSWSRYPGRAFEPPLIPWERKIWSALSSLFSFFIFFILYITNSFSRIANYMSSPSVNYLSVTHQCTFDEISLYGVE